MILRIAVAIASIYALEVVASPDQVVLPSTADDFIPETGNLPTLADLLTVETRASIYYSYAREVDISSRFMQTDGEGVTVFVPTNKAVQALARKPNEDPQTERVDMSDSEHESVSRSNVHRWVGAHVIPSPDVDFMSFEPYDTLTPGATITFTPIDPQSSSHLTDEPFTDSDAEHIATVKKPLPTVDTDAAHLASIKGPASPCNNAQKYSCRIVDTDIAHFSQIKGQEVCHGTHIKPRFGLASTNRMGRDVAHLFKAKGSFPVSAGQPPNWEQYVLNDGVRIIAKREASNGVLYMIDGTVVV